MVKPDSQDAVCPPSLGTQRWQQIIWKLTFKTFSMVQKTNQILPSYYRKNQILPLQENSLMFLQTIISSFV